MSAAGESESLPRTVAAVVPCYNAGDRVRPVVEALTRRVGSIIVVDDGSTDRCIATIEDLPVRLIRFAKNRGKGHALIAGFEAALEDLETQCIACLDADGQHDPAELPGLYAAFQKQGADLVIGSRTFGGQHVPWRSRFGNTVTIAVVGWLLGRRVPDTQSGYRLLSRRFVEDLLPALRGGRYELEMEMLARALGGEYVVAPVPIATIYEMGNPSSHFKKVLDSWRIYARLVRCALHARKG